MSNYTLKVGNKTLVNFMVGTTMVMRLYKGSELLWERIVDYSKARTLDELAAVKWADVGIVDGHSVMVSGPLTNEVVNENLESFESARVEHIGSENPTKFDAPPFFRNCVTFESNVPKLRDGYRLFEQAGGLVSFKSSLPSLVNGENMFAACNGMETWTTDLSSLVDGQGMFTMCTLLNKPTTKLPNLENGDDMFNYCSENLTEWDIDMPKLKSANYMFQNCQNLENFEANVGSLEDACKMFDYCGKINFVYPKTLQASIPLEKIVVSLPTGSWETHTFKFDAEGSQTIVDLGEMSYDKGWTPVSTITDGTGKFEGGYGLTDWVVQLPNLQTGARMFKSAPYNGWNIDLPSLQEANCMFAYSAIGSFTGNIHSLWNADSMFYSCTNLESFNEPLCSLTHAYNMFANSGIKTFNAPISGLTDSGRMFYECDELTSFASSILSSLEKGNEMFKSCSKLESFTASGTLVSLNDGTEMFFNCSSLTSFTEDMPSLVTGDGMFCNCSSLTTYQGNLNSLVYANSMFANGPLSVFRENLPNLTQAHAMFSNTNLQTFTSSLDQLVDGSDMFSNTKLPEWRIPLPSIENADWMFQFITPLKTFVSDMRSCTSATSMFVGCDSLDMVEPRNLEDKTALDELVTSLPSHVGSGKNYQYQYVYADDNGTQYMLDGSAMQSSSAILKRRGWNAVSDIRDGTDRYNGGNGGTSLINWTVDMPELTTGQRMFQDCSNLQTFEADVSKMDNATNMFGRCSSLTSFTGNTASLTNGFGMFFQCTNLTSVNIDLSSLQNGQEMFNYCHSLTSWNMGLPNLTVGEAMFAHNLSLRTFTSSVPKLQNASGMFIGDANLESVNCTFPSVTMGFQMFEGCKSLVNYSGEFPELLDGWHMFHKCDSLQTVELKVPKIGSPTRTQTGEMFCGCTSLVSVNLAGYTAKNGVADVITSLPSYGSTPDGSHVIMFQTEGGCGDTDELKSRAIEKGWLWMPSGEDISGAYQGNGSLTSFSGNLPQARVARNAFANCPNLQSFTGSTPNLQNATSMFEGCTSLQSMTGDMHSVTTAENMFKGCTSLEEVDNTLFANIQNADGMFENCTSFTGVFSEEMSCIGIASASRMFKDSGIEAFITDVPNLVTATSMFQGAQSFSRFETGPLTCLETANNMFSYCPNLVTVNGDMSVVTNAYEMFRGCGMLTDVGATFRDVTNGQGMFKDCFALTSVPENADFSHVTNGFYMFENCCSLYSVEHSFPSLVDTKNMFGGCRSLESVRLTLGENITRYEGMFNGCTSLKEVRISGVSGDASLNTWTGVINNLPSYSSYDGMHNIVIGSDDDTLVSAVENLATARKWEVPESWVNASNKLQNKTQITEWKYEMPRLTTATAMFQNSGLTEWSIELPNLVTANDMFRETPIESFEVDLPNVTNVNSMFNGCSSLTTFISDLSSLTTTNLGNMFSGCTSLTYLEPKSMPNGNNQINRMFDSLPYSVYDGTHLFVLDNTDNKAMGDAMRKGGEHGWTLVTSRENIEGAWRGNTEISKLYVDFNNVKNCKYGFRACSNITTVNIKTPVITNAEGMFWDCSKLTSVTGDMRTSTNTHEMFRGCQVLQDVNVAFRDVTDAQGMFKDCYALTSVPSNADFSHVTNGFYMFQACRSLVEFVQDLPNLTSGRDMFDMNGQSNASFRRFVGDTPNMTNGNCMFRNCTSLTSWRGDLSSLTEGNCMFSNCVLDLASIQRIAQTINTHNGTIHIGYAGDMTDAHILAFNAIKDKGWTVVANGTPYEKMEVTGDDYSTLTDGTRMFQYDTTLTSWENNLTNLQNGTQMFDGCTNLQSFESELPNLEYGRYMFRDGPLTSWNIDLPSLDEGIGMFQFCDNLTTFSGDLSNLRNGNDMFDRCTNLYSFDSLLPSLENGEGMFTNAMLNERSVLRIIDSLPQTQTRKRINIGCSVGASASDLVNNAIHQAEEKGWSVWTSYSGKEAPDDFDASTSTSSARAYEGVNLDSFDTTMPLVTNADYMFKDSGISYVVLDAPNLQSAEGIFAGANNLTDVQVIAPTNMGAIGADRRQVLEQIINSMPNARTKGLGDCGYIICSIDISTYGLSEDDPLCQKLKNKGWNILPVKESDEMTVVGTPLTQEEIRTGGSVYGGPNEKNIIRVNLPVQMYYTDENGKRAKASVAVNKLAAKPLIDAFTEVSSIYGNNVDGLKLNDYGGGWCVKKVQGSDNYSMHSYGLAIDINPSENSYDTTTDNATLSGEQYTAFVDAMERHGWMSLGRHEGYDWMHFQYTLWESGC